MRMRITNSFWCLLSAMLVSCAALTALAGIPTKDIVAAAEMISKVPTPAAKAYLEKELERILNLPDEAQKEQEFQKFLAGLQPGAGSAAAPTPATPQPAGAEPAEPAKAQQEATKNLGMPVETTLPKAASSARQEVRTIAVAFASNQFYKAERISQRLDMKMPGEFAEFYCAAMRGDMRVASQLYEEISLQAGREGISKSDRLKSPVFATLMDTIEARKAADDWDPALLKEFARRIYAVIPNNGIYFGGTDPGRFVVTAFQQALGRDDVSVLTQNALADATYMEYLRLTIARDHALYIPSKADVEHAFQIYMEDVQERKKRGEPVEEDVQIVNGKISVGGIGGVMRVNGILARMIFDQNTNAHAFCIEESYVINWMYPYLEPAGLILRLQPTPVKITPAMVTEDSRYWAELKATIGPALPHDNETQKAFSKCRGAIAGVYEYHKMFTEAERVYCEAIELCPTSGEANMRLAALLVKMGRFDDAIRQAESYQRLDPNNKNVETMISAIKAAKANALKQGKQDTQ